MENVGQRMHQSPEEQLCRTRLILRAAITKIYRTIAPKKVIPEDLAEKVTDLQNTIKKLLGDSFHLSWSTVDQLRRLQNDGELCSVSNSVLEGLCKTVLRNKDCPSPWQFLEFCSWLGQEEKLKATDKFLKQNFSEACEDPYFVLLPSSILDSFLTSADLQLDREVDAFRALLRWLQHDPTNRTADAKSILEALQVHRLSLEEMAEIDTVCKVLPSPILWVRQTFERRQFRFESWIRRFGIHVALALAIGKNVELSQLEVTRRRWERRRSVVLPMFHLECLTGSTQELYLIGADDEGIFFKDGQDSVNIFPLHPEFLGPVAYRYVNNQLFAVQNQGWRLKIWVKHNSAWTFLGSRAVPSWLYYIQLFANQDYLVIVGQRDVTAKIGDDPESSPIRPAILGPKEPFLCTVDRVTWDFEDTPSFPGYGQWYHTLGCTTSAFWVAEADSGRIWSIDLNQLRWTPTLTVFPPDDRVLCSTCTTLYLFVLSCNTLRGAYLTLSILSPTPTVEFCVLGFLPIQFPKSFVNDFISTARFYVVTEALECF